MFFVFESFALSEENKLQDWEKEIQICNAKTIQRLVVNKKVLKLLGNPQMIQEI